MSLTEQFTSALQGRVAAGDDAATVLQSWTRGDDGPKIITRCVMDLPLNERMEFLEDWQSDWKLFVLCSTAHPELKAIMAWVEAHNDEVLMLATASGPTPPAVYTLQHDEPACVS